jgi:hypothetical protein
MIFKPVIDAFEKAPTPLAHNLTPQRNVLFWKIENSCVPVNVAGIRILSIRVSQRSSKVLRDQSGSSFEHYGTSQYDLTPSNQSDLATASFSDYAILEHPPNNGRNFPPRKSFTYKRPQGFLRELQRVPVLVRIGGFAVPIGDYASNFNPPFVRVLNVSRVSDTPCTLSAIDALGLPYKFEGNIFRRTPSV